MIRFKQLKNSVFLTGVSLLLVGCQEEMMTHSLSMEEAEQEGSEEVASSQQLDQRYLVYMGKDELAEYRPPKEEVADFDMIDAYALSTQWENFSYEERVQTIHLHLEKLGYGDAPADLVVEYLSEGFRHGTVSSNVYNDAESIAEHLQKSIDEYTLPEQVTGSDWELLDDMQRILIAEQVLKENHYYHTYLSHYDMDDIPPQLLVASVNSYLGKFYEYGQINVIHYMNKVIEDMMLSNDHIRITLEHLSDGFEQKNAEALDALFPKRFDEEVLIYSDISLNFVFLETIKMDPILETYYGVADMTLSFKPNEEKLAEYEEQHGEPYPKANAFNEGKEIRNEQSRTLVVIKKNEDTEFGYEIRSISALDQNNAYASEFTE